MAKTTTWVRLISILNLILGIYLIFSSFRAINGIKSSSEMFGNALGISGFSPIIYMPNILGILVGIFLLITGFGLLARRNWAVKMHKIVLIIVIVYFVLALSRVLWLVMFFGFGESFSQAMRLILYPGILVQIGIVIIYIYTIKYFGKKEVKAVFK